MKVKFIYNPYSGENLILSKLDKVISLHQEAGYTIVPYRITAGEDVGVALNDIKDGNYKYILIAGGDGTVDSVVNAMAKSGISLPIGILPVGTANDFSKFLGMPSDIEAACKQILSSEVKSVDLGSINDKYFVNVASTGLFTDVSQKTDVNLKNTIGKLAYYLKGLEELPNFRNLKIKLTSKERSYNGDMYLILIFNGEHLDSDKVVYFKTDDLYIESDEDIVTDIDGEKGPDFPLRIQCIKGGIKILGAKRSEEHTSELQSPDHLVCRLLLEKKKTTQNPRKREEKTNKTEKKTKT